MVKYNYEFKKKVVEAYNKGEGGYASLARRFSIPHHAIVEKWVKSVEKAGFKSLCRRNKNQKYSSKFKEDVVRYYQISGESTLDVAIKFGLPDRGMVTKWHTLFINEGAEGLSPKVRGNSSMINKKQKDHAKKIVTREQELEREVELLRAELAFLKKLRALGMNIPDQLKNDMHVSFMNSEKEFKLTILLEATKFPKATYMYWQKRFDRENPNEELEILINKIFEENNGNYGYRRIQYALMERGLKVNQKKIRRIMRKLGLKSVKFTQKSRKYNSYKGTVGQLAKNRIHRRFYTSIPHQKITTDTTEFKYYKREKNGKTSIKKLYLDPFLDMFNGEIISYRISKNPNAQTIFVAQKEAIERTADCPYRRTFHSDQGWAYQMKQYRKNLKNENIFQSMSRKGNCYDNSPMENFFSLLKQEMYHNIIYTSFEELKQALENWIDYYNHKRIKSKFGCSPVQYRERVAS
ncbi:TPA: IS3 family transposase [Enterococcus faecalis]|nr:IS3 family transposase [Enterococcus faecalis]